MSEFKGNFQTRPRSGDTTSRDKVVLHIKKGDEVLIIRGDDAGKRGKVLRTIPHTREVVVQNVNQIWKHLRRSQQNPQGGRVRREAPLPISKVMLIDPATGEPTKVHRKRVDDKGAKVEGGIRFSKTTKAPVGGAR